MYFRLGFIVERTTKWQLSLGKVQGQKRLAEREEKLKQMFCHCVTVSETSVVDPDPN